MNIEDYLFKYNPTNNDLPEFIKLNNHDIHRSKISQSQILQDIYNDYNSINIPLINQNLPPEKEFINHLNIDNCNEIIMPLTYNTHEENKIPKLVNWLVPTLSVNEAAKIIVKTTKRKNKIIIKPNIMRFFVGFNKFFPNLLKWLIRVTG